MIKKQLLSIAGLFRFIKRELKPKFIIPFHKKIQMWSMGFSAESFIYYDFKKFRKRDFLTEYQMYCRAIKINAGYTEVMNNKLLFNYLIQNVAKVPKIYAMVQNGKIIPLDNLRQIQDLKSLIEFCKIEKNLIIKIFESSSGYGVFKLSWIKNTVLLNDKPTSVEDLEQKLSILDNYMICECVTQASYSNEIFPGSVNTVKVYTLMDPYTNEPFIAGACHRFGTTASIPVDNIGPGGCLAFIDKEDGVLSKAYIIRNNKLMWIDDHPDTGATIKGVKIPNWHIIKEQMLAVAYQLSFLKYVAWDIAIQDDGFTILEGNANTDITGFQPFKPLLSDIRIRSFYIYHKVIRR
jgi:hypothetical protein